jgi:hypothetical protein
MVFEIQVEDCMNQHFYGCNGTRITFELWKLHTVAE